MTAFVALLRGINVGGRNRISMVDLRQICVGLGYPDVRTYIQSGNVVFTALDDASTVEGSLEQAIEARLGLSVPVVVRTAKQWSGYLKGNPFLAASQREPNHLLMGLSKSRPATGAVAALRQHAAAGEQVEVVGNALWVFYAGGIARSRLSPVVIDRLVGSSVTARNWRTVQQLALMMAPAARRSRQPSRS